MNKKKIQLLKNTNSATRKKYFESHFLEWWQWYFLEDFVRGDKVINLAPFHFEWIKSITDPDLCNIIEGFRGSIKTTIILHYLAWAICYKKHNFIVWQSFTATKSEENTRNLAKILRCPRLMSDFGELYELSTPRENLETKRMGNYKANGVKVRASSVWEDIRGEQGEGHRPDCLILDDVDVDASVTSSDMIDKTYQKIINTTFGAMSKEKQKIILLGNTIKTDGFLPRLKKDKEGKSNWTIHRQPLFDNEGKVVWDFFTPEIIEMIKNNESEKSFAQNYLLIPIAGGDLFFNNIERLISPPYQQDTLYPDLRIYAPPKGFICVGVDTALGGVNGDYSTICVRDANGKLLAFYRGRVPPDILHDNIIDRIFSLGYCGTLGIESNNTGIATIDRAKNGKWARYLYAQTVIDERSNKPTRKVGWTTTNKSRPLMLSDLAFEFSRGSIVEVDDRELEETRTFVYNSSYKPEAQAPAHDDCIIADAICNQMRKNPYLTF